MHEQIDNAPDAVEVVQETTNGPADAPASSPEAPAAAENTNAANESKSSSAPTKEGEASQEDARIAKVNREAANYRTQLREAEKARDENAAKLEELLKGLNGLAGGGDEDASPEDQLAAANSRIEELQAENRNMRITSLVNMAASSSHVDSGLALAVLNSEGALASINPADSDAASQVEALVKAAVEKYPQLATQEVPRRSGNSPVPPEGQRLLTAEDMNNMTPEEIYKAQREGKFDHLLKR